MKKEEQPIPEVKKEVQVERVFKVDEYYPENHKERTIVDSSIPASRATKFQYFQFLRITILVKYLVKKATAAIIYNI